MPVTYTNRKGVTYYLCKETTKTGKPRYYFAREPKAEPVEEIPEGWEIRESPNGIVSLAKKDRKKILPEEAAAVKEAVERHPESEDYRVSVKHDRIEVYERVGPDADGLLGALKDAGVPIIPGRVDDFRELVDRRARYSPVLRFVLRDEEERTFKAERMTYRGEGGWKSVHRYGPINMLTRALIPKLGTDDFFRM